MTNLLDGIGVDGMSPVVLHIEDDSNDVLLFQHAYRKAAGEVRIESVSDGDEALAYLKGEGDYADRQRHPLPELVVLDLKMPRVNGFEVLSWLRQERGLRTIPVVVLSSSNHQEDVRRCAELGGNSYVVKPVSFEALVDIVEAIHHYWLVLNEKVLRA